MTVPRAEVAGETPGFARSWKRARLEVKVRQYALGQRFVAGVVQRAGMDGFNRVWERPENIPSLEEVGRPNLWVERVAGA